MSSIISIQDAVFSCLFFLFLRTIAMYCECAFGSVFGCGCVCGGGLLAFLDQVYIACGSGIRLLISWLTWSSSSPGELESTWSCLWMISGNVVVGSWERCSCSLAGDAFSSCWLSGSILVSLWLSLWLLSVCVLLVIGPPLSPTVPLGTLIALL